MKLSYHWLKSCTPTNLSPEALAHKLTMAGLEVKGIEHSQDGDVVFESEITPNRPDCLSHLGVAREMSAILSKPLKLPTIAKLKIPKKKCDIAIADKEGCLRYIGAVVQNVKVGTTDDSIKTKISSVGVRSVNNVVDVTNFCLMETGQPLHAFDYDKLIGGKIIVRRARDGETLVTIDGLERKLDSSILVIADEKRPVAIAGIMGGKNTEVTKSTKNILLESAYFNPLLIRRAARKLGISSDSSYRFERGIDMGGVLFGAQRALSLISSYAGGNIVSFLDIYPRKITAQRKVTIDKKQIDDLLGVDVSLGTCQNILAKLGFKVSVHKNTFRLIVPNFRGDVTRDVDIIEEIARIVGYDNVPASIPTIKISFIQNDPRQTFREGLADHLTACGLNEAISLSMTSAKNIEKTRIGDSHALKVKNPLSAEQELMRPSLLPGLLSVVATNLNRGQKDLRFFELGKIYSSGGTTEKEMLGIVLAGKRIHDWREPKKEDVDFYDIKGVVEQVGAKAGMGDFLFEPTGESFFAKGKSAAVSFGGNSIGRVGAISQDVLANWDIKQKGVFFAEIDIRALISLQKKNRQYNALPEFPAINRDISLAVKSDVSFEKIRALAFQMGGDFLTSVKFIEQYSGEKIPQNYRGLTVSLVYQSLKRTLREEEVNTLYGQFAKTVVERFGAIKR